MDRPVVLEFPTGRHAGEVVTKRARWSAEGVVSVPANTAFSFEPVPPRSRVPRWWRDDFDFDEWNALPFQEILGLPAMSAVTSLAFTWQTRDSEMKLIVDHMNWVNEISLEDTETMVTSKGLRALASLPNLRSLRIYDASKLTFADCVALQRSTSLQHLRLSLISGTGPGLAALAPVSSLTRLDLSHSPRLKDADLAELVHVPQLAELDLRECTGLTKAALKTLAAMPNLRKVSLSHTKIPSAAIATFQQRLPRVRVDRKGGATTPTKPLRPRPPRAQNPKVRVAVERHAVNAAIRHLKALKCTQIKDVGATKSWDLECMHGASTWRIEVKGAQGLLGEVQLTENEVRHAQQVRDGALPVSLGLFICTDIVIADEDAEAPLASDGTDHWFFPWAIDDSLLRPTAYSFAAHRLGTQQPE